MKLGNLNITANCLVRARQRGYRPQDLETMETLGTLKGDGIFMRKKDVAPQIERLSTTLRYMRSRRARGIVYGPTMEMEEQAIIRQIEQLHRLSGAFIPIESGHALSIYRLSRRRMKRVLHGGRRQRADRRHWR